MTCLSTLIAAWGEAHREFDIVLGGIPDADLWRRPAPNLLSIGEIAGHVAYWQAVWTLGGGNDRPDLAQFPIASPLIDHRFRYYTTQRDEQVALELTTEQVATEVRRIHEVAKSVVEGKAGDDPFPGQWGTWGYFVQYQVFHVAYHAGQVYSARHTFGHETQDN